MLAGLASETPSGLIKMSEEAQAFEGEKLDLSRECFIGMNI
jgi:hypothetical protein